MIALSHAIFEFLQIWYQYFARALVRFARTFLGLGHALQ
jgi:hypothetical protein